MMQPIPSGTTPPNSPFFSGSRGFQSAIPLFGADKKQPPKDKKADTRKPQAESPQKTNQTTGNDGDQVDLSRKKPTKKATTTRKTSHKPASKPLKAGIKKTTTPPKTAAVPEAEQTTSDTAKTTPAAQDAEKSKAAERQQQAEQAQERANASATASTQAADNQQKAKAGEPKARQANTPPAASNIKMAKAMLFSTGVPLASCFLYMAGFWPGALIGAPIAFLSGRYGRKLRKEVNEEQVSKAFSAVYDFTEKLKNPEKLEAGDFSRVANDVLGTMADVRYTKLGGLVLGAGKMFQNSLGNPWIRKVASKLGITKIFQRIAQSKLVTNIVSKVGLLKTLDAQGSAALQNGAKATVLKALLRGMSINMRVANADTPMAAVGAGLMGLGAFILWPVTLAVTTLKAVFGGKSDKAQPQNAS